MRTRHLATALAIGAVLSACGGGSSPTTPTPTPAPAKAIVGVLLDPNPVNAVPTGNNDFPWEFRFNLQISDSGGVGFIVTSMETAVISALSGSTLTTTAQNPFVGVKVAALGQETRQFSSGAYRMENFTRQARVTVKMNFTDDRGNASVFNGTVTVQHDGKIIREEP